MGKETAGLNKKREESKPAAAIVKKDTTRHEHPGQEMALLAQDRMREVAIDGAAGDAPAMSSGDPGIYCL